VQVVFLSNPYEANDTSVALILFIQAMMHIWHQNLCHCR